ncbi:HDIG domain-containing protein [candidate division KSB1 bacterium]|nr:HDIG domain-containing protein [candidate division KSB1 bacterium]
MNEWIKKIFAAKSLRNNSSVNTTKKKDGGYSGSRAAPWIPLLLAIPLTALIVFFFPRGKSYEFGDLKVGDVYIGKEVIAPFTFPINKSDEQYTQDIEKAKNNVYPVFGRSDSIAEVQTSLLKSFFSELGHIRDSLSAESAKIEAISGLLKSFNISISDDNLSSLVHPREIALSIDHSKYDNQKNKAKKTGTGNLAFDLQIIQICREIFESGVLNVPKSTIVHGKGKIAVRGRDREMLDELTFYYDEQELLGPPLLNKLKKVFPNKENLVKVGYQILVSFLQPNVFYNETETNALIEQAVNSVPLAKGMVLEKERIIDTHQRVSREHKEKLTSLAQARKEREEDAGGIRNVLPYAGRFFLVVLSLLLLGVYIVKEHRKLLLNFKQLLLIHLIILFTLFLTFIINKLGLSPNLIPIALAAMLLTIFFDSGLGFVATISMSIIMGGLRGNNFNVVVISIIAGAVAVVTISKVRTRNWLVQSILWIVGAYIISISALELLRYAPLDTTLIACGYGALNGILSPILVYGLITIIELTFDMTTDMTLLELSDLNNPILKEMALKASGTYFHSILIGNLSEAAAEAIGANSLLARVGGYYHDIGKIKKPGYFIENQNRGRNPHERLSPSMSFLILVNHVRGGLELARKYKLPKEIKDFIAQHHGTGVANVFYKKAIDQKGGKDVNESDFRYPGPKPQSKETAIVMLADAVEAASRSLKDPTVSRIQAIVNSITRDRFLSSELDECPLTLRELNKIGESFQNILIGIFHARIEYPDQDEKFFKKGDKAPKEKLSEPAN